MTALGRSATVNDQAARGQEQPFVGCVQLQL